MFYTCITKFKYIFYACNNCKQLYETQKWALPEAHLYVLFWVFLRALQLGNLPANNSEGQYLTWQNEKLNDVCIPQEWCNVKRSPFLSILQNHIVQL